MLNEVFKWSSQYITTDPTKKPDLKPMSKEDMEFLEKAFESVTINETKEFITCLSKLQSKEEENTKEDEEFRLPLVEKMMEYIDGLEVSRNIVRQKKFKAIIDMFFETTHAKLKLQLARLIGLMLQNDLLVQKDAINNGILKCLDYLVESESFSLESNRELVEKTVFILCGLIYGQCSESKTAFVFKSQGFSLLKDLYVKTRLFRILKLIEDLTKPEDNKAFLELNLSIIDEFFKNNLNVFLIEVLLASFKEKPNDDDSDVKRVVFSILANTCFKWDENDFQVYNEAYKVLLNLSLKEKLIVNEEIKSLIRESNSIIKENYKNRKTKIEYTESVLKEMQTELTEKTNEDSENNGTKEATKILCLDQ